MGSVSTMGSRLRDARNAKQEEVSQDRESAGTSGGFTLIELIIVVMIIAILAAIAIPIFADLQEQQAEEEAGGNGVVTPTEETAPAPAPEPAEPINWNPLIIGAGGLLGLVALGGGGFFTVKGVKSANRSRREAQTKRTETIAVRENTKKRHQDVLVQYSAYETDLWKALSYPALHDVEVEETSNFLKAMRDTDAKEKELDADKKMLSAYLYEKYETAVSHLEHTFTIAENKALRLGEGNMSEDEQKDMKTARMLLGHAEDSGNNAEMRANYYEQLRRVINRLNERHRTPIIPQLSVDQIEHKSRLLLTDGDDSGTDSLLSNNILNNAQKEGEKVTRR